MSEESHEARTAALRHVLRNRLSAIRNAVFYLRRKSEGSELWESEKRIETFFDLIDDELELCTQHITEELTTTWLSSVDPSSTE